MSIQPQGETAAIEPGDGRLRALPAVGAQNVRIHAFTLIELLVVVAVIALLIGLMLPVLGASRSVSRSAVCLSNLRQVMAGVSAYAVDHDTFLPPAASDIYTANLQRWHGLREDTASAFEPSRSVLADYLGGDGAIKECPALPRSDMLPGFEDAAGGYGYNHYYLGGRVDRYGYRPDAAQHTARLVDIRRPTRTVAFTDTAFLGGGAPTYGLIAYSFAEPPTQLPATTGPTVPSIHHRHVGRTAQVAWADGHADAQPFADTLLAGRAVRERFGLGWFGPATNAWFDLE